MPFEVSLFALGCAPVSGSGKQTATSPAPWPALAVRVLAWLAAFSPAAFVFLYILPRRSHVPFHDSWAFVQQYRQWSEGSYSGRDFMAPHNMHPSAVGKAIYFAVLQWCRGDVGLLPLLTWAFALAVSLWVMILSRPLWRGSALRGAGLMLMVNFSVFTLAQGHVWLWDFLFQNAIPGMCLVLGLMLLRSDGVMWWRWLLAATASVVATFSFGTGFAVGILLLPTVWFAARDAGKRRVLMVAGWFAMSVFAAWLALRFFVPSADSVAVPGGAGGRLDDFITKPWDGATYILALLGHTLGQGTSFEPVTMCAAAGLLLAVFFVASVLVVIAGRDAIMWRAAWPWVAMTLWAALNAVAICLGRWRVSLDTAIAERYGQFMLFMVVGVTMLVMLAASVDSSVGRLLKRLLVPAAAVLVLLDLLAWRDGWASLEIFQRTADQQRAAMFFVNALPPQPEVLWQADGSDGTAKLVRFLRESGRLRGVDPVPDAQLSRWRVGGPVSDKWAHWELLRGDGGMMEMRGVAGLSKDLVAMPDLVLVTVSIDSQPERIIALAGPTLPDDFFVRGVRRRQHYEHYFGWRWKVDESLLPKGGEVVLKAYAFNLDDRKLRPIEGRATLAR